MKNTHLITAAACITIIALTIAAVGIPADRQGLFAGCLAYLAVMSTIPAYRIFCK